LEDILGMACFPLGITIGGTWQAPGVQPVEQPLQ
jgi:hypothetical protein